MEKYEVFLKEISEEESLKEFSVKLSEEEESSIKEFSKGCFKKFGEYPSKGELKTLVMHYLGKKLTENGYDKKFKI
jgi:hypothetical protein